MMRTVCSEQLHYLLISAVGATGWKSCNYFWKACFFYCISFSVHDWLRKYVQTAVFSIHSHVIHIGLFLWKWISLATWLDNSSQHDIKMDPIYFLNARSWFYSAWFISRWYWFRLACLPDLRSVDYMCNMFHWYFNDLVSVSNLINIYFIDQTRQYKCHWHRRWTPIHCVGADMDHYPLFPGNVCQLWL